MSHDQGLTWPRNTHSSRPHAQPALDRPSLFAGMEPDADEAPERVRILSTLAASRPPSKRASGRSRRGRGNSWQFKALLALMGLGIVGLLAGFAMVLAQGHSQAGTAMPNESTRSVVHPLPAVTSARQQAPTAALSVPASSPLAVASTVSPLSTQATASAAGWQSAPAPQAAVIENVAPAAVAGLGTVAAASPLAALNTAPTAAPPPHPASPKPQAPSRTTGTPRSEPSRVAKTTPQPTHAEARTRKPATKRGQDADVALLEAMFTHTRSARSDSDKRRLCAQQPQSAGCAKAR